MKRIFLYLFVLFSFHFTLANSGIKTTILPTPKVVKLLNGSFNFRSNITISISSDELEQAAELIQNSLNNYYDIDPSVVSTDGSINLQIVEDLSLPDGVDLLLKQQAYQISINDGGIIIKGLTTRGLFYGAMSLVQLIEHSDSRELQHLTIIDWPDLNVRGISDDISRGQVSTVENFKRIIDFLARYKMNTYMLYLEDMLKFDYYSTIGKQRGALTKDEITEIVNYASERYIDIIPVFQTLGHFENILSQKEFLEYAEYPGAASLSVSEDTTYAFLENMLNEVFELFPSDYINIGADESFDVGRGKSKELVSKTSIAKVHAEHYKKVYEICTKNGKKVMMYGDIILSHKEILELIPKDIIIVDWHYNANTNYTSTNVFRDAGFNYFVSPSVWNYRTTFPVYQVALPNIKNFIKSGINNGSSGMINSNWGDYGAETFKEFVLYGYAWSAQCSWSSDDSKISEFNDSFFADFFGINDSRLSGLYKIFSSQFNQMQWHEVWRHPVLKLSNGGWWESRTNREEAISWMEWTLPEAYDIIDEFSPIVTKNQDHLELLRYLIYLDLWYINKLKTQYYLGQKLRLFSLQEKVNDKRSNEEEIKQQISWIEKELKRVDLSMMVSQNISELNNLKDQYEQIWLTYYKHENLNMIIDKFDRLIAYFSEVDEQLSNDTLYNPIIESEWLYCAKNRRRTYNKAEYKKEFSIKGEVEQAYLQLIGDSHAKLYINGKYIDEVFARRSLSLVVEYKRFLYLDITDYLKSGKNKIVVKAESYSGRVGAGFNLISEIKTDDKRVTILSDKTWLSKPSDIKRAKWRKVITKKYKYDVIAPNFNTQRTSWIER